MSVYAMVTSSSPRCAMGPGIGTQLPADGHQMSVLRSVKSFECEENDASISQVFQGLHQ